jgi:hypothetical protein
MILWDILTFPFTAPVNGTVWVVEQIRERTLAELYNPDQLRAELLRLQISYERGMISEAEEFWDRLNLVNADSDGDVDGDDADEDQ